MADGNLNEKEITTIMSYTSKLYGGRNANKSLNEHRAQVFERAYSPKKGHMPLQKLKGLDATLLPPCEAEIIPKIKRASFVARMWAKADQNHIDSHPAEADGWLCEQGLYEPVWFDGPQMPDTLVPTQNEIENDEDDEVESVSDGDMSSDEDEDEDDDE